MKRTRALSLAAGALFIAGCGASQEFESVPKNLDRSAVQVVSVAMTAHRYEFVPDTVRLEEGVPKDVEIYAAQKGAYTFKCCHICGIGHLGMNGVLLVE